MAQNAIPRQNDRIFALGDDMIDGLNTTSIGIVQNTAAVMTPVLATARAAENAYQTARQARVTATTAQTLADSNAKAFIAKAKGLLENTYGSQWSTAWAPVGYVNGSLALPSTLAERYELLASMKAFFTANSSLGNAPLGVTAAAATALHEAYNYSRLMLQNVKMTVKTKFQDRERDVAALVKRMRGLIDEIATLVGPDDPVWYAFGLNAPGDPETPGVPAAPMLTEGAAGSGTLLVDWEDTRRADHYRVWRKLDGEADFTAVASVSESEAILLAQPLGVAIQIRITAVNDAGESVPGAISTDTLS